jgi:hypothetical protein
MHSLLKLFTEINMIFPPLTPDFQSDLLLAGGLIAEEYSKICSHVLMY